MHLLRLAYCKYIRKTYGNKIYPIHSASEESVNRLANKLTKLRIPYDTYISLACKLMDEWTKKQGWKYPYWNIIANDKTIEHVSRLLNLTNIADEDESAPTNFELELSYALAYMDWKRQKIKTVDTKPERGYEPDTRIVIKVAEYLCELNGIECITSDYNKLYRMLEWQT